MYFFSFIGDVYTAEPWKQTEQTRLVNSEIMDAVPDLAASVCNIISDFVQPILVKFENSCNYSPTPVSSRLYSPTPMAKRSLVF